MTDLTVLLDNWIRDTPGALERLLPHVYPDLHALARAYLRRGATPITLRIDREQAELFSARYLLGCTAEEAAELTGLSKATVDRRVRFARAWLFQRLRPAD